MIFYALTFLYLFSIAIMCGKKKPHIKKRVTGNSLMETKANSAFIPVQPEPDNDADQPPADQKKPAIVVKQKPIAKPKTKGTEAQAKESEGAPEEHSTQETQKQGDVDGTDALKTGDNLAFDTTQPSPSWKSHGSVAASIQNTQPSTPIAQNQE